MITRFTCQTQPVCPSAIALDVSRLQAISAYRLLGRSEWSPDYRAIARSGWVFFIHQLEGSLHKHVLHLVLILLLQSPFYLTGNRENLRVRLKLLRDKKYLGVHLHPLLKSAGPLLLIAHHVGCKLTESQKFSSVLIYRSVQLL